MLKRWTALLLAVMLIFLTACGAQKEYKLSAVFAAAEEDRTQWLADPDNAAPCGSSWAFPARSSRMATPPL